MSEFTIREMQKNQPWTVPYSKGFQDAADAIRCPHLYAAHTIMHAMKSVGKLAAVFEGLDHRESGGITQDELHVVSWMAADLVTAAMRLANLYEFDLQIALERRVKEKNGVGFKRGGPKQ